MFWEIVIIQSPWWFKYFKDPQRSSWTDLLRFGLLKHLQGSCRIQHRTIKTAKDPQGLRTTTIPAKSSLDTGAVSRIPYPPWSMLKNIVFFPSKKEKITWFSTLKVGEGKNLLRVPTLFSGIIVTSVVLLCNATGRSKDFCANYNKYFLSPLLSSN